MNNTRKLSVWWVGMTIAGFISAALVGFPASIHAQDVNDCSTRIKEIDSMVDQLIGIGHRIGRVQQRIGENLNATDEQKVQAVKVDEATLESDRSLMLKTEAEIQKLVGEVLFPPKPDCKSNPQELAELIKELESNSEEAGRAEQLMTTDKARTDLEATIKKDELAMQRLKTQIQNTLRECCMEPNLGKPVEEAERPWSLGFGYIYERASDELAKNLNGINGQVFFNFAQHIGIGGDVAWTTGSDRLGTTTDVKLHRFTALAGPKIKTKLFFFGPFEHTRDRRLSEGRGMELFFQPLIGFVHDTTRFQSLLFPKTSSSTAVMTSVGGGMDVMFKKNAGVRWEVDYQLTHFGGFWQNNIRIATGIVFRFGKEKELPTW